MPAALPEAMPPDLKAVFLRAYSEHTEKGDPLRPPSTQRGTRSLLSRTKHGAPVVWRNRIDEEVTVELYCVDEAYRYVLVAAGIRQSPVIIGASTISMGKYSAGHNDQGNGIPYFVWDPVTGIGRVPSVYKKKLPVSPYHTDNSRLSDTTVLSAGTTSNLTNDRKRSRDLDTESLDSEQIASPISTPSQKQPKTSATNLRTSETPGSLQLEENEGGSSIAVMRQSKTCATVKQQETERPLTQQIKDHTIFIFGKDRERSLATVNNVRSLFAQAKGARLFDGNAEQDVIKVTFLNDMSTQEHRVVRDDEIDFEDLLMAIRSSQVWDLVMAQGDYLRLAVSVDD